MQSGLCLEASFTGITIYNMMSIVFFQTFYLLFEKSWYKKIFRFYTPHIWQITLFRIKIQFLEICHSNHFTVKGLIFILWWLPRFCWKSITTDWNEIMLSWKQKCLITEIIVIINDYMVYCNSSARVHFIRSTVYALMRFAYYTVTAIIVIFTAFI